MFVPPHAALTTSLSRLGSIAVAVSGGVDSVTLAAFAHDTLGKRHVLMLHAVSPAVPSEATERLVSLAAARGWDLRRIDAGELADPRYVENPSNRCFFCKTDLYAAMKKHTDRTLVSGTNTDDLADFRPGLGAAREAGVVHPFVEAGLRKDDIRDLARVLGLGAIAELPASPCLASRIATGITVSPERLRFIEEAERLVRAAGAMGAVRCRVRQSGVVIELQTRLPDENELMSRVAELARAHHITPAAVSVAPYVTGSAFLRTTP